MTLSFTPAAVKRIAEIAADVNAKTENIGARRLQTAMERLLETISFDAPSMAGTAIEIGVEYVEERFADFAKKQDLARYIL